MDFPTIDSVRQAAGISQYRLCQEAGVHPTTYWRLRKRPDAGKVRTVVRLDHALKALLQAQADEVPQ